MGMPRKDSKGDWVYPTPVQNTVAAREILLANLGLEQIRLGIKLLNKGLEQQKVALSGSQKLVSDSDQCRTDPAWAGVRSHYVRAQYHHPNAGKTIIQEPDRRDSIAKLHITGATSLQ